MPTPSMEDHIEQIYLLIEQKGYARVSDIAESLSILPSSVTKMVQRLDKDGYLIYERYRGLMLTPKGLKLGKRLVQRHDLLEQFLCTKCIIMHTTVVHRRLVWEKLVDNGCG